MFDLEWSKLLVIGAFALLVIKPKDLPRVLRTLGYWVRQARQVASEFQSSVEQMAREAELADVKKEIEEAGRKLTSDVTAGFDPVEVEKKFNPPAPDGAAPTIAPPELESTAAPAVEASPDEPTLPFPEPAPKAAAAPTLEPADRAVTEHRG